MTVMYAFHERNLIRHMAHTNESLLTVLAERLQRGLYADNQEDLDLANGALWLQNAAMAKQLFTRRSHRPGEGFYEEVCATC